MIRLSIPSWLILATASSLLASIAVYVSAFVPGRSTLTFSSLPIHTQRTTKRSTTFLKASASNEDLSGGIFFDGPTDFTNLPTKPTSSSSLETKNSNSKPKPEPKHEKQPMNQINKDIVIIGAGLAGLSTALHISLHSNRQITILEKEDPIQQMIKTPAASFAAAGMLAPHSERLPSGPLLDLCLQSRDMYTDFASTIESITANCGIDASKYLWKNESEDSSNGLEPWEVGYAATGGFLAPAFAGDSVATWSPPPQVQATAKWLDEIQVHEMEPSLHPDVIGGWWFPEDASVDARRLTCALRAACIERGVQFLWGEGSSAGSLELGGGKCKGIRLGDGRIVTANSVVVANGSWMRNLLPVPITPHKGQSFSLRMPKDTEPILSRILFAQDTYIVPKADGRIVIGATVEVGTFDCDVTPSGMMHCMANALQLVPGLANLPVEETWAGLRPTTPDKGPILGRTSWDNLFIAGGYWRNGVLLAPKTGQLIGDLVIHDGATLPNEEDEALINAFNWDRFTAPEGGKVLAANARYAASMHPVHRRASGAGVAAAVGTELGFYSGADAAKEERKRDREALFQDVSISDDEEDAFERAARLGLTDATAFETFGQSIEKRRISKEGQTVKVENEIEEEDGSDSVPEIEAFDGTPDALTVGYKSTNDEGEISTTSETDDLDSIYQQIQMNKAKSSEGGVSMNDKAETERPDPGFRVYHVEKGTRKVREVPPYTSPPEMMARIESEVKKDNNDIDNSGDTSSATFENPVSEDIGESSDGYDETTFDGYQTIQEANSSSSRGDELEKMKIARMANRLSSSQIDESNIGVFKEEDFDISRQKTEEGKEDDSSLSDIYSQIRENKKSSAAEGIEMETAVVEERPDPGFRVYHVNRITREEKEVPPYTSPGDFLASIETKDEEEKNLEEIEENYVHIDESSNVGDILDGYRAIEEANGNADRGQELEKMREVRQKNRSDRNDQTKSLEAENAWGE